MSGVARATVSGAGAWVRLAAMLAICCLALASAARADSADPLGSVNSFFMPIPSPSFDTTRRTFVIDGQVYNIPRNYVVTAERTRSGKLANVSMRALLPDLSAISPESARCFQDRRDPCSLGVVTIGLQDGELPDAAVRLESTRAISKPEKKKSPCGFEYFESLGSIEQGNIVFEFLFTKFPQDRDLSILRCPAVGSPAAPFCNSADNIGNGNVFYYVFPRSKLCEWGDIKQKVLSLIASFQEARTK